MFGRVPVSMAPAASQPMCSWSWLNASEFEGVLWPCLTIIDSEFRQTTPPSLWAYSYNWLHMG
jgi:hypothetical protein